MSKEITLQDMVNRIERLEGKVGLLELLLQPVIEDSARKVIKAMGNAIMKYVNSIESRNECFNRAYDLDVQE